MADKTHREVKTPRISARALADYMAASETAQRTIVRSCKYQATARVLQHDEAKVECGKFIRSGGHNTTPLTSQASIIRARLADTAYDRDLFDHNADYIDRFASIAAQLDLPDADRLAPGTVPPLILAGIKVNVELQFRLRRLTKTNKVRTGAGMLRYAKGKPLSPAVGDWPSAFVFGYLIDQGTDDESDVEHKLCLTVDAYSGKVYGAPSDSVRRYQHMKSACLTIAERWPNIQPPPGAIL